MDLHSMITDQVPEKKDKKETTDPSSYQICIPIILWY